MDIFEIHSNVECIFDDFYITYVNNMIMGTNEIGVVLVYLNRWVWSEKIKKLLPINLKV